MHHIILRDEASCAQHGPLKPCFHGWDMGFTVGISGEVRRLLRVEIRSNLLWVSG